MSVIFFDARELATIAVAACGRHVDWSCVAHYAKALAAYSEANAAAFGRTYRGEQAEPVGAGEIVVEVEKVSRMQWTAVGRKGRSSARMLNYNATSNGGRDYLEEYPAAALGLARVLSAVLTVEVCDG